MSHSATPVLLACLTRPMFWKPGSAGTRRLLAEGDGGGKEVKEVSLGMVRGRA